VYGIVAAMLLLLVIRVLMVGRGDAEEAALPPAVRAALDKVHDLPNAENYDALSFQFYQAGMYERSIAASKQALRMNATMPSYFNNLCAAYNGLGDYQDAVIACQNALRIDPAYQLARNNFEFASKHLKNR
jgi:tetratricopeptide (TPR) repeat protein